MSKEVKQRNIPWIGKIPDNWTTIRLKNIIVNISSGHTPLSSNEKYYCDNEDGMPWVTIGDMSDKDYVYNSSKHITNLAVLECNLNIYKPETILYAMYASVGEVSELMVNATLNQAILGIVFNNELVNRNYVKYALRAYKPFIKSESNGTTQLNLNLQKTINLVIPYCSLIQQNIIVDAIRKKESKINALIANEEKQIEKLKAYKQSLISDIVTKGLNPNVPMKDSGFYWYGKIRSDAAVIKTLWCLSMPITDGPHESPVLYDDGIPFISAEAISFANGGIDFNHARGFISEEYYKECCKKYIPQTNDIYMIKSGATTGKVAIVTTNKLFTIWSPLAVFRVDKTKVIPKYMFYFLQSNFYQKQVQNKWNYGTQQNIGMRVLEQLFVILPDLEEQSRIVSYLDNKNQTIDNLIGAKTDKMEKLNQYRQSMIYEYVTGKKEAK